MSDLAFVRRCTGGDKEAWNEFIEKYSLLIYSYIHSVLKIRGTAAARENIDDLFQDIFLSLSKDNYRKLRGFQGKNGCSLASWLRQVTVNRTIDFLRALRPALSIDQEDEEGNALKDILVDSSGPAPDGLSYKEKLSNLEECIAGLGRDDKLFLELHLKRGVSLEKMKECLRISRGAVDMRKSRIIERLKECFKAQGLLLDF